MAQALTPSELFESGAGGTWSSELYHLPSSYSPQPYLVESGYGLRNQKEDVVNDCVDPRVIWSEGGEDVGCGTEEEDDHSHSRLGIKGKASEYRGFDYQQCLVCHVRDYHVCTCNSDAIPTAPPRPAAAAACINFASTFSAF